MIRSVISPVVRPVVSLIGDVRRRGGVSDILKTIFGASAPYKVGSSINIEDAIAANVAAGAYGVSSGWTAPQKLASRAFSDPAGSAPVYGEGVPIGLVLDNSQGGSLGLNLVENGGFDSSDGWTFPASWSVSGGKATAATSVAADRLSRGYSGANGTTYLVEATITMLATPSSFATVAINIGGPGEDVFIYSQSGLSAGVEYKIVGYGTPKSVYGAFLVLIASNLNYAMSYTVDDVSIRAVGGSHWRNPPSGTNRPTLIRRTSPFSGQLYYAAGMDGVNDWLETGTLNPAGATEAHVVIGVEQLKGLGADTCLFEYGPNSTTTAGTFGLFAPAAGGTKLLGLYAMGATAQALTTDAGDFSTGAVKVISASVNLATGYMRLRVNGVTVASQTVALGGTFSSQLAYMGRRAGASLPAQANFSGITFFFGAISDDDLSSLESWHLSKN